MRVRSDRAPGVPFPGGPSGAHVWRDGRPLVIEGEVGRDERAPDKTAELVKAYLGYMASTEGQTVAKDAAGTAPLSSSLSEKVSAAVESIK